MPDRPPAAPVWFAIALVPMVASQLLRLQQTDPYIWVLFDYAGRLGALAVLFAVPAARKAAFRFEPLRIPWWEVALWAVGIAVLDHVAGAWIRQTINAAVPALVLGRYPATQGALHVIDIAFGLALVAWHEEIMFRRYARDVLSNYLGDGFAMVAVTSLLFGIYHWWSGPGTVAEAAVIGAVLMLLYRRAGALWPAVLAHYLTDIVDFI
jgi:membrane protease YdiL (CAAX protease family)